MLDKSLFWNTEQLYVLVFMLQDLRFMLRYLTFSLLKNWKKLCFENQLWRHYFQSMKQESSVHTDFFCLNSWMKWCEFLFSSLCSSYIFVTVKFAVKNGTYCLVWSCTNWYFSTARIGTKNSQIFPVNLNCKRLWRVGALQVVSHTTQQWKGWGKLLPSTQVENTFMHYQH